MKIKIERSGGMAGMHLSREMDAKDLPISLVTKIRKILEDAKSTSPPLKSTPKGAADHYTYKISVQAGKEEIIMKCNQYDIPEDLKLLVRFLELHSKKRDTNV